MTNESHHGVLNGDGLEVISAWVHWIWELRQGEAEEATPNTLFTTVLLWLFSPTWPSAPPPTSPGVISLSFEFLPSSSWKPSIG